MHQRLGRSILRLYYRDTEEWVAVSRCGIDSARSYFGSEPVTRAEEKVRVKKGVRMMLSEMIKKGCELMINLVWIFCYKAFESGTVTEEGLMAVINPLYKSRCERNDCRNYSGRY